MFLDWAFTRWLDSGILLHRSFVAGLCIEPRVSDLHTVMHAL